MKQQSGSTDELKFGDVLFSQIQDALRAEGSGNFRSYERWVRGLDKTMEPYKDKYYKDDLKKLEDFKKKWIKGLTANEREDKSIIHEIDYYYTEERFKIIMRLIARVPLLPIRRGEAWIV